jgi:DMSO/TMAO reductase YedYZ heme-binding membrane subunit
MARAGTAEGRIQPERGSRVVRLSGATLTVLAAVAALAILFTTDQVLPATSAHQAQLRIWLGSRAAGLTALVLLSLEVVLGLILSHPTNKSTWRLSKRLFPWHEHLWVFTVAFVVVHVVSIATDRFANVGWLGALVPGLSEFRTVPVALGTLACYALLITGLTARLTRLLPAGWWLKLHRLSLGVLALAWAHGMLAGSDTFDAVAIYAASFLAVALAAAYRYWIVRTGRPTFATSLTQEGQR